MAFSIETGDRATFAITVVLCRVSKSNTAFSAVPFMTGMLWYIREPSANKTFLIGWENRIRKYIFLICPTSNDTVAVDGTGVDDAYLGVDDTAPPATFIGGMVEV